MLNEYKYLNDYDDINSLIMKSLLESELKIFSYEINYELAINEKNIIKTEKKNYILSIPLYLSNILFCRNKIIFKLPSNFFSQYEFLCNFSFLGCSLEIISNYPKNFFKSIKIQKICKFIDLYEHKCLFFYHYHLSHKLIHYAQKIEYDKFLFNEQILKSNSIIKIKINLNECVRGFFFYITYLYINFIEKINFYHYYSKSNENNLNLFIINFLNLDNKNYLLETDQGYIFWLGVNQLDLNPFEYNDNIKYIKTNSNTDYLEFILNYEYINLYNFDNFDNFDIISHAYILNVMTGSFINLKLKYINNLLNNDLIPKELELINKYDNLNIKNKTSNDILFLIKNNFDYNNDTINNIIDDIINDNKSNIHCIFKNLEELNNLLKKFLLKKK